MKKISLFRIWLLGGSIIGSFSLFLAAQPVFADGAVSCDRTAQQFRQSGEITCGHIQWKMYSRHASQLSDDPLPYLKKYETLYTHLAQFTGAEPANKQIIITEKCPSWRYSECPNGRMEKPESVYLLSGTNTIAVSEDFFERIFSTLARDSRMPLSETLFHEMGHAFLPQMQSTGYSLLWDNSSAESFVDLISVVSYLEKNNIHGGLSPLYWDAFCQKKLQIEMCGDYLNTPKDFFSVREGYEQYISDHDTFDTIFTYPQSQEQLIRRSEKFTGLIGSLSEDTEVPTAWYDGLNKAMRFYNLSFSAPRYWSVPFEAQTRDMTVQKTNLFIFLLSAYAKTDFTERFQSWGFPVMRAVRESFFDLSAHEYSEDLVPTYVQRILKEDVSNQRLSSALTNIWIEEPASGNTVIIRWKNTPNTESVTVFRSENESTFPLPIARDIRGTEYRDTNLFDGKKYLYALVGTDVHGHESPVSDLLIGTPKQAVVLNYGQFSLLAHQIQDITDKTALVAWHTDMPATARLVFGMRSDALAFSMEAKEYARQNAFSLSGLVPSTLYYYELTLTDAQGRTIRTARSFVTANSVQTLKLAQSASLLGHITIQETGTTNSVKIQWRQEDAARFSFVRIYRSSSSWERGELRANISGSSYWYDNTLMPYTQYFYKIAGITGSGEEIFTEPLVVIIGDTPRVEIVPTRLRINAQKIVSLSWNAPSYFSSCMRVRVYRSAAKGKKGTRVGEGGCDGTFLEKLDPLVGTRYYYSLYAVNTNKKESVTAKQYDLLVSGRQRGSAAVKQKQRVSSMPKKAPAQKKQKPKVRIVPSWGYPPAEQI